MRLFNADVCLTEHKKFKRDLKVSQYFPLTHLNSPTIFESKGGAMGTVVALEGAPFDTETVEQINRHALIWQQAIKSLNEAVALHVTLHRYKVKSVLTGSFPCAFAREIDERYHAQFKEKGVYKNALYLTVIYKGITAGKTGKFLAGLRRINEKTVKTARENRRKEQIKSLDKAVALLVMQLTPFKPHILGTHDEILGYSELTEFLSLVINGGEKIPHKQPVLSPVISDGMLDNKKASVLYPTGFLGQYLSRKRIYFGNSIQFQGASAQEVRFAAMLSIKQYAEESQALILDPLLDLDGEFISTHTFAILARESALEQAKKRGIQLNSAEDAGYSQINALHELRNQIANNEIVMGYHHHTLMLITDQLHTLEPLVNKASSCYDRSGMVAVREDVGQQSAFWAQIPTNFKMIARSAMITSRNFTDFCSLHNYRSGYRDANHLGGAVTILETLSKTPYFFNFHEQGFTHNKTNILSGHTLIIGASGAGKTALMAFLDAQCSRYNGRTFVFDRKRGLDTYIRASNGYYTTLSPNEQAIKFNPFQLEDTPINRQFCCRWLEQLVKDEQTPFLEQQTQEAIKECVEYAFSMLTRSHRTLSNAVARLPADFSRWPSLRRWLRASGKYPAGSYAYLFDNDEDTLTIHKKMGFDMTHFLDNETPIVRSAVMMYILHCLSLSLDGTLMSIYLDEGWQYLNDPYWQEKLKEFFGAFRSKNAHIVFATQSAESVVSSALKGVILDNIVTKIIFANSSAKESDYIEGLGLTQEEFLAIKNVPALRRAFLIKQKNTSCLCTLSLDGLTDLLPILSSNESTLRACDTIRQNEGDDPLKWLPILKEMHK